MAVAVHDDDAARERPQFADEPAAVDERGADPFRERHDRHGIFDEVVMQRDDPSRLWISADRSSETAALFDGDQSKRVGEGEMRLRVRIEDGDAEPVLGRRRQNHWELIVEDASESGERRKPPFSAKATILSRCSASASLSVCASRPELWAITRTRSPWTAAIAESVRICRSRLPVLNGRSSRAGLARSTMFTS